MATASSGRKPVIVVAAGGADTGKTTALNNIFGTDFPTTKTRYSAVREVLRDGRSYILIDTPGFQSTMDMSNKRVGECITDALRGLDFTLLLCLPVDDEAFFGNNTKNIVINLQNCLHNRIWEKCVLLLTFSDDQRNTMNDSGEYKDSIAEFAIFFKDLLDTTFDMNFSVHTIFDYKDDYTRQNCGYPGIVAVPVQKEKDKIIQNSTDFNRNPDIIPGISLRESWVSCLLNEINSKIAPLDGELKEDNFKTVKNPAEYVAYGGYDMAPVLLGGPIGAGVAGIRRAVSGISDLFTSATTTFKAYVSYRKWTSVRPEDQIRRLLERIHQEQTERGSIEKKSN